MSGAGGSKKRDLYRVYQTSDTLSFLDASLVKRIEPLLANRARPECIDLLAFVELVWQFARQHSDVKKGEEKSYVESLCVLFQEVATQHAEQVKDFGELPWSLVTDHFIRQKIRTQKKQDDNGDKQEGAAGNNGGQREAPRFSVGKIADYSTHKGGICCLEAWHRWGLLLSADREYPGVKVYDAYTSNVGPPIYCGDLPFFPYNMSGGSLIRRSDVSLPDYIQNMCTPPTALDVQKGSKLKNERIMVPPKQVIQPPKGAFPVSIAVDDKNDVIGVIFSSRHLCFWSAGSGDGGLRLQAAYPVAIAFTGLWFIDGGLGEWVGAFDDFNMGMYSREKLRLTYGNPMSFNLVPTGATRDPSIKLVAPSAVLRGHMDQVVQVIQIPDAYMASASYDSNVLLWDRTVGAQLKRISTGCGLRGMAFNPVMDLLLTVGFGPEASLYHLGNLGDGSSASSIKRAGVLRGHISGLTCCAFMGSSMAITCDDVGYIRLWDLKNNFQCFQLIQNETIAGNIAMVYRLEDGYYKLGHQGRNVRETVADIIKEQETADFVIGGERLLKMKKIGQPEQAGNIPQVIFADFCYLNHSLVIVTEQFVYSFHCETGAQLECVSAATIFQNAEENVPEKDRDQGEITLESIQGIPATASHSSQSVANQMKSQASTLGKMGLSLEEEDSRSQRTDSREADSRLQTSVERAFTGKIKEKRVHRKKELQKLALEKKYGIGFDKKPKKSSTSSLFDGTKNKMHQTSAGSFFGGAGPSSTASTNKDPHNQSLSAFDDLFAPGHEQSEEFNSSKMSKTHSGSFFPSGNNNGTDKKKNPKSVAAKLEQLQQSYELDKEETNEHVLEDNQELRKDNKGMETIQAACFDGAHARLILGSDRGKIIIVDNKSFQPICPRLRNTHDTGRAVTHLVYIPKMHDNIGHYRYYDYAIQKRALMSEITEKVADSKYEHYLPEVEHHLRQPLNLPEAIIASAGSDGAILLVEDNPARGYPLLIRLTYSPECHRLKNFYFDFESGYLVSMTDTEIKWWEPHLDQGDPARVIPIQNNDRLAHQQTEQQLHFEHLTNSVTGTTSTGAAAAPATSSSSAAASPAMVAAGAHNPQAMMAPANIAMMQSDKTREVVNHSAGVKWRKYGNNLGFSVDAHSGEVCVMNMEKGEVETSFLHQKSVIHKDEVRDVNFRATCLAVLEHDVMNVEWADPTKKSGPVNFASRPPAQTPPSTAEQAASRTKLADLASFPDPATAPTTPWEGLLQFPFFKDFAKVVEQAYGRSIRGDLPDGVELRRAELERQQCWLPEVRQLRQRNLYDEAQKQKTDALKKAEVGVTRAATLQLSGAAGPAANNESGGEQGGQSAAVPEENYIHTAARDLEASAFLFEKQSFFLTQDPRQGEEIHKSMNTQEQPEKKEVVERFLSVLYDLANRTDIEIQAASELATDFGYLQDLENARLKQYFSDPKLMEAWSFIIGKLDESFWGPDGNPIDDTSDQLVSTTGKLKKSLMGKSALPADTHHTDDEPEAKPSSNAAVAAVAQQDSAAAAAPSPDHGGESSPASPSGSSGIPKVTKKRVKDPRDLYERRVKYKERAKDLFKQPQPYTESKDQSCIIALGNEKGEISLVKIRPERVTPRRLYASASNVPAGTTPETMTPDIAHATPTTTHVFGGKVLVIHRETICTWKAHDSGKISSLRIVPGVHALISCGEAGDVKIWPLDTFFGSDGRDREDELNGVDHKFVQKSLEDRQKLILSDTVFYKKPWVSLTLGPETTSKTLTWYLPRVLRQSLLFAYQGFRVMHKLHGTKALETQENSLYMQTSIHLYDRYYGKLRAEQDLQNEHKRREAELLQEKSKGISLVEVKSYTVSQVKAAPEPDSLRPLTIFKELTQTTEKPWVANWKPMKKVDPGVAQVKEASVLKPKRGSVTGGPGKKSRKQIKLSEIPFPDRLTKASNEWNFERLYGRQESTTHAAQQAQQTTGKLAEKVLRRTFSDTKSLSWRPDYDEFAPDHLKPKKPEEQRRRKKQDSSVHMPAEQRLAQLKETIAEPISRVSKDPSREMLKIRKWESFLTKEKGTLPESQNVDWLRQTMPARFRADKTHGAASPERHISSPEKARFLLDLEANREARIKREGLKPSLDTRSKFKPEVNMGRDYSVSGGDVMLRAGEAARRRSSDMQHMLLRQYPRRSPEEEQKLMDIASKAGEVKLM